MPTGPPPSEAGSSQVNNSSKSASSALQTSSVGIATQGNNQNTSQAHLYPTYTPWNPSYSSIHSGYGNMTNSSFPGPIYPHANPYLNAYSQQWGVYTAQGAPRVLQSHLVPENLAVQSSQPSGSAPLTASTLLPKPDTYIHWEESFKEFFSTMKLFQASKGLESDFLVLNEDWEQKKLPEALDKLIWRLKEISERMASGKSGNEKSLPSPMYSPLNGRKLSGVTLAAGKPPQTPSDVTKSISKFIARSRSRNNASNRAEFLHSLAERRRKAAEADRSEETGESGFQEASCARTDARTVDRDKQMKYDIAKNEDGPLARSEKRENPPTPSMLVDNAVSPAPNISSDIPHSLDIRPSKRQKLLDAEVSSRSSPMAVDGDELEEEHLASRLPGVSERVRNLEEHMALRYVPSSPRTILARIKYLEAHLVKLEKEYPPWAALHFNQPNRGWPPPPRSTPIIVPPHLRSNDADISSTRERPRNESSNLAEAAAKGKGKTRTSTLTKAVMDRLEVQKAMDEIEGRRIKADPG